MLSEKQTENMLAFCESKLGREIGDLRASLQLHDDKEAHIWELVVLYLSILRFPRVDHEPSSSTPDVLVFRRNRILLSLEARVVGRQKRRKSKLEAAFRGWV